MNWNDAQDAAIRTEPNDGQYNNALYRLEEPGMIRLLHAAMGLCTEAGELMDQLKRHVFYGKPIDRVNLLEEGGDVSWYLRILAEGLKDLCEGRCAFEEMVDRNVAKLRARFPDKFAEAKAITRDLSAERDVLEKAA